MENVITRHLMARVISFRNGSAQVVPPSAQVKDTTKKSGSFYSRGTNAQTRGAQPQRT